MHGLFPFSSSVNKIANRSCFDSQESSKRHVMLMIIDALRADYVFNRNHSYYLKSIEKLEENGKYLSYKLRCHSPTALLTGTIPSVWDVIFNYNSSQLELDNLLFQYKRKYPYNKIAFYGDDTWIRLFPHDIFHRSKGLDHIGHASGAFNDFVKDKLLEYDKIKNNIFSKMTENDTLIITDVYGMTDQGGHGEYLRIDLTPTLSALLQISISSNNLGIIIENLLQNFYNKNKSNLLKCLIDDNRRQLFDILSQRKLTISSNDLYLIRDKAMSISNEQDLTMLLLSISIFSLSTIILWSESQATKLHTHDTLPVSNQPITSTPQSPYPVTRSTEHVQLVKHQALTKHITVESASACCNELVGLRLECAGWNFVDEGKVIVFLEISCIEDDVYEVISLFLYIVAASLRTATIKRNINIFVGSLEVTLPSRTTFENNNIEIVLFEDACDCISDLLSITDKLIYLVLSATLGVSVVPLIHNHRCIEHIYIYQVPDEEESIDWIQDYPKILGSESSIDMIANRIKEDIDLIMKRSSRWSRSKELLAELCSQAKQTSISASINDVLDDNLNTLRIVLLYLGPRQPFHLSHNKIRIDEFRNIEQCIHSIQADNSITVFLIISMNEIKDVHHVQSIAELDAVHAIYIVTDLESYEQIQPLVPYSKLSGIFVLNEDLLEQLTTDICFYRQIRIITPNMNVFKIESNTCAELTEHQINFLRFQLFSTILSQLPTQSTAASDTENIDQLRSRLIEANTTISNLFKNFNKSILQISATKLHEINQRIVSLAKNVDSSTVTVYRAQLVSQKDLEMIKTNPNALLTLQTFILASRSFRSIANMCRRAADNQLTVVLFELNLSERASVVDLNSDTVVFNLGTLFRLVSTDPTPDGVWRAQLEFANNAMQYIKNQLQSEIGSRLTWLTFGNYLTAIKQFPTAEEYYQYLLDILPSNHPSLASVYNNIGLMYAAIDKNQEALESFEKALQLAITPLPIVIGQAKTSKPDLSSSQDSPIEKINILNKIAEISCRQGDYTTARDFYHQALEIADDVQSRKLYKAKIDALAHFDDTC
ncbi:unnamed protein product [Rotaria socialis]